MRCCSWSAISRSILAGSTLPDFGSEKGQTHQPADVLHADSVAPDDLDHRSSVHYNPAADYIEGIFHYLERGSDILRAEVSQLMRLRLQNKSGEPGGSPLDH
jgi:hypothetical protein